MIEQILGILPRTVDAAFYRTATGVEIDLVITAGKRRLGIEIKHTSAPSRPIAIPYRHTLAVCVASMLTRSCKRQSVSE